MLNWLIYCVTRRSIATAIPSLLFVVFFHNLVFWFVLSFVAVHMLKR